MNKPKTAQLPEDQKVRLLLALRQALIDITGTDQWNVVLILLAGGIL